MDLFQGPSRRIIFFCPEIAVSNKIAGLRNLFILREKMDKTLKLCDGPQVFPPLHGLLRKMELILTLNGHLNRKGGGRE